MGHFAAAMMKEDIKTAHRAMMEGDIVKMVTAYYSLKGYAL